MDNELSTALGSGWATNLLKDFGLKEDGIGWDIVWLNAEAKEAFSRTNLAQNLPVYSELYQQRQRSFVSGAVDTYEAAYQRSKFGTTLAPDAPTALPLKTTTKDDSIFVLGIGFVPARPFSRSADDLDSARFNEYGR